jgi:hypothetical protein
LSNSPSSYGGRFSITKPVIIIPNEFITYTEEEQKFLFAQQIGQLAFNDHFFKMTAKVLLIAVSAFIYLNPYGWLVTAATVAGAFTYYLIVDWAHEFQIDQFAIKILANESNIRSAKVIAAQVLNKICQQNIKQRGTNFLTRLFISPSGNDLLDFRHPFLTSRLYYIQL